MARRRDRQRTFRRLPAPTLTSSPRWRRRSCWCRRRRPALRRSVRRAARRASWRRGDALCGIALGIPRPSPRARGHDSAFLRSASGYVHHHHPEHVPGQQRVAGAVQPGGEGVHRRLQRGAPARRRASSSRACTRPALTSRRARAARSTVARCTPAHSAPALIVVRAGPMEPCSATAASVIRSRVSCSRRAWRARGSGVGQSSNLRWTYVFDGICRRGGGCLLGAALGSEQRCQARLERMAR